MFGKIKIFIAISCMIALTNCSQVVTYKAIKDEIRVLKAVHTVATKHDNNSNSTTTRD